MSDDALRLLENLALSIMETVPPPRRQHQQLMSSSKISTGGSSGAGSASRGDRTDDEKGERSTDGEGQCPSGVLENEWEDVSKEGVGDDEAPIGPPVDGEEGRADGNAVASDRDGARGDRDEEGLSGLSCGDGRPMEKVRADTGAAAGTGDGEVEEQGGNWCAQVSILLCVVLLFASPLLGCWNIRISSTTEA